MFLEPGYQRRESGLWVPEKAGVLPGIGSTFPSKSPPRASKTDNFTAATSSPYTFTGANLGTPETGRLICVAIAGIGPSLAVRSLTGVTIAGNAATLIVPGAAQGAIAAFAYIFDSTNATGNIVATFNSTMASCAMVVYALYNVTTPYDTDTPYTVATATTLVANLDELYNGISLFAAIGVAAGAITTSWSAATQDQAYNPNTNTPGGAASYKAPASVVGRNETVTWSATATNRSVAAVHWR